LTLGLYSKSKKEDDISCSSFCQGFFKCFQIEKEVEAEIPYRISKSSRVDLSNLNRKK